jgi:putative PIN family toxin of toxin-antitoxin system
MHRAIIDTNLWVSFLIGKTFYKLKHLLIQGVITPIFSPQLLDELTTVTQRPKLQKYFQPDKVQELLLFLNEISDIIEPHSTINLCRDPKDNFLLALAQDSKADFLVTGDQDLLILQQIGQTKILTYQDLLSIIS